MATTLTARLALSVALAYADSRDLGSASADLVYNPNWVLTDGAGLNQAKKVFDDTRTLAASASEDLDLAGVLTDAFGQVLALTKVKALIVVADATNVNNVIVGGAAANGFVTPFGGATHTVTIRPGGAMILIAPDAAGYAVTAATADLLKIANSGAGSAVTYTVIVVAAG